MKIEKMIEKYNRKAIEWGYEPLSWDAETHTLSGKFAPQGEEGGFIRSLKMAYRNGYLKEDYEKILKEVSRC